MDTNLPFQTTQRAATLSFLLAVVKLIAHRRAERQILQRTVASLTHLHCMLLLGLRTVTHLDVEHARHAELVDLRDSDSGQARLVPEKPGQLEDPSGVDVGRGW